MAQAQICNPNKRYVEVSIGAQTDASMFSFIESGRRVILPNEFGNPAEHDIVISDSFLTYIADCAGFLRAEKMAGCKTAKTTLQNIIAQNAPPPLSSKGSTVSIKKTRAIARVKKEKA